MTFQERIKQAFEEEAARRSDAGEPRLTKTDIWKAADASSGAATHWFNGSNGMDMATCMKVAPLLRVNAQWLYEGTGAKRPDDGAKSVSSSPPPEPWPFPSIPEHEVRALPSAQLNALQGALGLAIAQLKLGVDVAPKSKSDRLDKAKAALLSVAAAANDARYVAIRKVAVKVRAGVPGFSANQTTEEFIGEISLPQKWLDERKLRPDQLIATSVFGDSLEPRILKDDLLLVNTADTARAAGKLFAVNHEGEFAVKRLERRDGHWHLVSDNSNQVRHPPVRCTEKTFIIGRVVMLQAEKL